MRLIDGDTLVAAGDEGLIAKVVRGDTKVNYQVHFSNGRVFQMPEAAIAPIGSIVPIASIAPKAQGDQS